MAHIASNTGMPIMRSMNLMFPNDPKCDNVMQQYMFGDSFLVAAFTDRIYLPEGRWIDYWTGKAYEGKQELTCQIPEDRGGLLFIRDGAIIPYWGDMDFVSQRPLDNIFLHVYPNGESSFTLYEDDGITYKYLEDEVAKTEIKVNATDNQIVIDISPRSDSYDGMPKTRSFEVKLYCVETAKKMLLNGNPLANPDGTPAWYYDQATKSVCFKVTEDPNRIKHNHIVCVI